MMASPPRRFTLFDAMVLIAATAAGMAGARWQWGRDDFPIQVMICYFPGNGFLAPKWFHEIFIRILLVLPFCVTWMIALLVLRMCHPRPAKSELLREPGFVAGATGCLMIATYVSTYFLQNISFDFRTHELTSFSISVPYYFSAFPQIGRAISGAWLLLLWGGGWQARPHWLDRAGRAVAIQWIFWAAITPFCHLTYSLGY